MTTISPAEELLATVETTSPAEEKGLLATVETTSPENGGIATILARELKALSARVKTLELLVAALEKPIGP